MRKLSWSKFPWPCEWSLTSFFSSQYSNANFILCVNFSFFFLFKQHVFDLYSKFNILYSLEHLHSHLSFFLSCNQYLHYSLMTSRIGVMQSTQTILNDNKVSIIKQHHYAIYIHQRRHTLSWEFTSTFFCSKYSTMPSWPPDAAICSRVLSLFTKS